MSVPTRPVAPAASVQRVRRVLDPSERTAEVLFGLIMVLTFTGSLSVAEAGRDDVHAMLVGAIGCNLAWGIIDGVLYLMGSLADRNRNLTLYRAVSNASETAEAETAISEALPPLIASAFQPADFERVRQRVRALPAPPERASLMASDWQGALGVCLLVFLSTFPVALPFVMMRTASSAMRVSNAVAVVMLFLAGVIYGRAVGRAPWAVGLSMVLLGCGLVALTIALGG
jgi:VIT1/CCC1 family predicted Fe2+/Mn2+ transporter